MLTAPAGYGKTTLAAEWLQARPPEEVAWYQATAASADVAALSVGIADAAAHILPAGERLKQRLTVPQPPKDPAKTYAELLAVDFAKWPKSAWLVIDDYHQIVPSEACERFVEALVELSPVRLLVTTRGRPSWASARRLVYGEIAEIDQSSLRMTDEECTSVLQAADVATQEDFLRAVDGWPALIGIASLLGGLALGEEGKIGPALFEFLQEEILKGTSAETYALLVALAQLPTADDALIEHCFGKGNVSSQLSDLVDAGLVTSSQGERHLHPLFREVLQSQDIGRSEHGGLIERALLYYESASEWQNALTLATARGLRRRAAEIVGAAAPGLLREGRLETLDSWIAEVGHWAFVDRQLILARAEMLLRRGRPLEARLLVTEILQADENDPAASNVWRILGQASHLLSEYERGLECYERAETLASSDDERRAAAWGLVICGAPLHSPEIHNYYARFETLSSQTPDDLLRLAAGRVAIADMQGSFSGLWEHLLARIPLLEMATDPLAISTFTRCLCYVSLSQGDFATSHSFANKLISFCRDVGLTFPVTYVLAYRAMAEIGLRQFSSARRTLSELEEAAPALGDPHLVFDVERIKVRLALATGGAAEWISEGASPSRPSAPVDAWADYAAICALAHACVGDPTVAAALAKEARGLCGYPSVVGACVVATSVAELRLAEPARDMDESISAAIIECGRIGSLEPVVVAYRAEPRILREAKRDPKALAILLRLLDHSRDRKRGIAAGLYANSTDAGSKDRPILTPREEEVMHLLAQGRSTQEIAASLVIARSTAKVHVNHILRKLDASSRLQAVLHWQRLSLDAAGDEGSSDQAAADAGSDGRLEGHSH